MDQNSINIFSKNLMHFSTGEIYLIQSKIELGEKDIFGFNGAIYLNYSFEESKKIGPFFDKLGSNEQKRITTYIREVYGYKMRVDDLFGKLIVVLFFNIELYDLLIIGLVGLGSNSIDTLIEIGRKVVLKTKCKTIILTKTSPNLSEDVCISALSHD